MIEPLSPHALAGVREYATHPTAPGRGGGGVSTPAIRAALEQWRDLAQTDLLCPANPAETDWGAVVVAIAATRAALAQSEGEGPSEPAPAVGEGPSLADVDELCIEFCFHPNDDSSLEILQEMICAALARWGRPAAPSAPEPAPSVAASLAARRLLQEVVTLAEVRQLAAHLGKVVAREPARSAGGD